MFQGADRRQRSSTMTRAASRIVANTDHQWQTRQQHRSSSAPTPSTHNKSVLVDAAALQQHFTRGMHLSLAVPSNRALQRQRDIRRKQRDTKRQRDQLQEGPSRLQGQPAGVSRGRIAALTQALRNSPAADAAIEPPQFDGQWQCHICSLINDDRNTRVFSGHNRCDACGSRRDDSAASGNSHNPSERLDLPALTLAQKRGLVAKPPPPLSQLEWGKVEELSAKRCDSEAPCSICLCPFGIKEQVILSCSHVFHSDCLASFERFLRSDQRTCPLCRKNDYEKKATTGGLVAHRCQQSVRLQCWWRRCQAIRYYRQALKQLYVSGGGNEMRRRNFFADRIGNVSDRLCAQVQARQDSVDSLFAELDRSLALSRAVLGGDSPGAGVVAEGSAESAGAGTSSANGDKTFAKEVLEADQWEEAWRKALARGDDECPICINEIGRRRKTKRVNAIGSNPDSNSSSTGSSGHGGSVFRNSRSAAAGASGVMLLNCSHVLHMKCLRAFESFNIYEVPLCPVCRQQYRAIPVKF